MANSESLRLSIDTTCQTFLTRRQTVGLVIVAEASLISTCAVLILFCIVLRNVLRYVRNPPEGGWRFFRSPLDVYMLSLLTSDTFQGIGGMLDVKWINDGIVQCGSYCTAQGIIQQVGETSVAMTILAIALHTFIIIVFRKGHDSVSIASIVVCAIWLYVIIFSAIGASVNRKYHIDAPTPYWCWIRAKYLSEQIAGEYFWLWFAAAMSVCLYIPVFFCIRGNFQERWWRIRLCWPIQGAPSENDRTAAPWDLSSVRERRQSTKWAARKALNMLLYPACYVAIILPLSIARWIDFRIDANPPDPNNIHEKMPSAATFLTASLFDLSGLVNVTLLISTRRGLLLLGQSERSLPPGPAFGSSASVLSSTREPEEPRLRTFNDSMPSMRDDYRSQNARDLGPGNA